MGRAVVAAAGVRVRAAGARRRRRHRQRHPAGRGDRRRGGRHRHHPGAARGRRAGRPGARPGRDLAGWPTPRTCPSPTTASTWCCPRSGAMFAPDQRATAARAAAGLPARRHGRHGQLDPGRGGRPVLPGAGPLPARTRPGRRPAADRMGGAGARGRAVRRASSCAPSGAPLDAGLHRPAGRAGRLLPRALRAGHRHPGRPGPGARRAAGPRPDAAVHRGGHRDPAGRAATATSTCWCWPGLPGQPGRGAATGAPAAAG